MLIQEHEVILFLSIQIVFHGLQHQQHIIKL